ncbi:MAG: NAD(P)H-hydrate dehydratase [Limisphaerales bacterium]
MGVPVITIAQMREWEAATWAAGITEKEVIDQVGRCVAERAIQLTGPSGRILLLAGKGHNGDDVRAASKFLAPERWDLIEVATPEETTKELSPARIQTYSLVVDGLFGIGINRPLNESWQRLIALLNNSQLPVLAVDTPSGLNADSGEVHGTAIRAEVTLTVGAPKVGLLLPGSSQWVGRLEVASNVGLIPCPCRSEMIWTEGSDFARFPPTRAVASHKGTYGHVVIYAGSLGYHGAAVLAARGAQRAQPGLVSLFTFDQVYLPIASQLQAAMVHLWREGAPMLPSTSALLFGPGLAAPDLPPLFKAELRKLWLTSPLPVIADASGLDWLPSGEIASPALRVMTPHPGEAARLLKQTTESVQSDRPATLRQLSARYGNCWVVLKGHQTLVGRSDGQIHVNSSGNPYLAQGGSGDVLAGYIAGLLAQSRLQPDPGRTIRYAVWQHGAAADLLSRQNPNWTVEDFVAVLGRA